MLIQLGDLPERNHRAVRVQIWPGGHRWSIFQRYPLFHLSSGGFGFVFGGWTGSERFFSSVIQSHLVKSKKVPTPGVLPTMNSGGEDGVKLVLLQRRSPGSKRRDFELHGKQIGV